jgi:hypothetical protein
MTHLTLLLEHAHCGSDWSGVENSSCRLVSFARKRKSIPYSSAIYLVYMCPVASPLKHRQIDFLGIMRAMCN